MVVKLTRLHLSSQGIFGKLELADREFVSLEHAYLTSLDTYSPKLAKGTYTCVRHAPHRLPYETWEVTGVPDFEGQSVEAILIHIGNFQEDSEGCILVGTSRSLDNPEMIKGSRAAFRDLMILTSEESELTLVVI
jgi:hypothetical protein